MTFLIGSASVSAYTSTLGYNSDVGTNRIFYNATGGDIGGVAAIASGNAATLRLYISSWGTVANAKFCLYDLNASNVLLEIATVNNSVGTGEVSISLADTTAIVSGTSYQLGVICDTNADLTLHTRIDNFIRRQSQTGTYSSPPDPLAFGGTSGGTHEFYWAIEDAGVPEKTVTGPATATDGASVTITGTGFSSSTANIQQTNDSTPIAQAIDSQTATTLEILALNMGDTPTGGSPTSACPLSSVTVSAALTTAYALKWKVDGTTTFATDISNAAGLQSAQTMIAEANTTSGSFFDSAKIAVEDNMQLVIPTSVSGTTITLNADGTFTLDADVVIEIPAEYFSPSTGQWSLYTITTVATVKTGVALNNPHSIIGSIVRSLIN